MIKVCAQCESEFKTDKSKAKYCSRDCSSKSQKKQVELSCEACGGSFKIYPSRAKNRRFCSVECRGVGFKENPTTQQTHEEVAKRIKDMYGNEYVMVSPYVNMLSKVSIKHSCGHEYEAAPSNLLSGRRCPRCYGTPLKRPERFKEQLNEIHGDSIKLLTEYKTAKIKVRVLHTKCGYEYETMPNVLLHGHSCPKCKESKGEKAIEKFLIANNIKHTRQYRIKECRDQRPLPFDFAIFNGDELVALIEYQGEQHYRNRRWKFDVDKIAKHDDIKREFCKTNNIPLIEIRYTVVNIDAYLIEHIPMVIPCQAK